MAPTIKKLEALRKRFDERSQSQPGFSLTFGPGNQYRRTYTASPETVDSDREFDALCRQCIPLLQTLGVPGLESGDLLYWARDHVVHERHTVPRSWVYGQGEGTVELLSALDHPYRLVATALSMFLETLGDQGKPAALLRGWRDILIALGMKHNDEDKQKVSALNKSYEGPIHIPGRGCQPLADKGKLIEWWNGLAAKVQAEQDRQRDAKATISARYNYGGGSEVAPDISGGVKKRRCDRKP